MADPSPEAPRRLSALGWLLTLSAFLVVPLFLVVVGRDPRWWQAWAFSAVFLVSGMGGRAVAERRHPGLLTDRMRFGRGQDAQSWDRVLAPLMGVSVLYAPVIVAGLDHRYGWTAPFPVGLSLVGLALCVVGYGFAVWAFVENRFFTSLVRIQSERGHEVCDRGPYRVVRHPGYAGTVLTLVGIPLALGSVWAFVACGVAFVVSVVRTSLEDRMLMEQLPGYRPYARRVRFRLLPGVW